MPEQTASTDIAKALEFLEDYTLTTNLSRCQNYQTLESALDTGCDISEPLMHRLLAVCVHDLKEDMKYAVNTLNIIALILKKIKAQKCTSLVELVPSALAVLHIIKTTALISKLQALQTLSFDTLLLYPNDIYKTLVTDHVTEVMGVFDLYFHERIPVNIRLMPFALLLKILKALPSEKRAAYLKDNINMWFSKIIPTIMSLIINHSNKMAKALDALDILTENLENIDYSENAHWQTLLECIYIPQRYPAIMKTLLESGKDSWWRIWIIFVKLLKQQITMNKSKLGSPINSMLPVVEMAFKMDVANRCRAFQCWIVLTNNFATEVNESFISKRLKLLIIPLKSNNAKVEETALAKFDSWWHLIKKFETKSKFFDLIYVPFLHFCFGNSKDNKNSVIPGQLSLKLKKNCVQAFVESSGHVDCDSCVSPSFPHLAGRILSPKLLYSHLCEWLHALKSVIKIVGSQDYDSEDSTEQMQCIWKSFLEICSKVQEENRNAVLNELINMLFQLVQECLNQEGVLNIIFNILLPAFFSDTKVKCLLTIKGIANDGIGQDQLLWHKMFSLVLKPPFCRFYPSSDNMTSVAKMKSMTNALFDKSQCDPNVSVEWLLNELPTHDNGLILWTALAESINENECDLNEDTLEKVILWPLRNMQSFQNIQFPASVWNIFYTSVKEKLRGKADKEISIILQQTSKIASSVFALYALLHMMKQVMEKQNNIQINAKAELLVTVLSKFKDYKSVHQVLPLIVECLVLMLTKVNDTKDASLAELTLTAANYALKLILETAKNMEDTYDKQVEILLKSINETFKNDAFIKFKSIVLEQTILCGTSFKQQSARDVTCSLLKTILAKSKETEVPLYSMVQTAIVSLEKTKNDTEKKDVTKFTSPKLSSATKTKKEPSIVNTVVENGEEFVVVKSHWKFNPRKLTENQKEKFQKKREIPALYQDLSQSQDEFKMTPWKTDSQDASTTNNSSSNSKAVSEINEVSSVLKKMPSTEAIPKIMENIFSGGSKTDSGKIKNDKTGVENIETDKNSPKKIKLLSLASPKQSKSPRVALKDRVFQNVKNLIEKSTLSPERKISTKEINQPIVESHIKTPTSNVGNDSNAIKSAPPKIVTHRPSRLKRKPKKYELDYDEVYLKKNRRNSLTSLDSQMDLDSDQVDDNPLPPAQETNVTKDTKHKKESNVTDTIIKNVESTSNIIPKVTKTIDTNATICDVIVIDDDVPEAMTDNKEIKSSEKSHFSTDKHVEETQNSEASSDINLSQENTTTPTGNKEMNKVKSIKKKTVKKSRIEKELAIDMVEGHPFLQANDKRATRKSLVGTIISTRRKALTEKLNKLSQSDSKIDVKNRIKLDSVNSKPKPDVVKELFTARDSKDSSSNSTDNMPLSEDFIESSQDSTITTVSVKSNNTIRRKQPVIVLSNIQCLVKSNKKSTDTQSLLDNSSNPSIDNISKAIEDSKEDIEFPQNKTIPQEDKITDLTADMDTEPMEDKTISVENNITNLTAEMDTEPMEGKKIIMSNDVILITDDAEPVKISSSDSCVVSDSQCTANADTLPMDPNYFAECVQSQGMIPEIIENNTQKDTQLEEPTSTTLNEIVDNETEDDLSSPYKDEAQRNQDFLNSTIEISPIKVMSPVDDEKTCTLPQTSNDFVVIKLASPVECNGEPFEKSSSPGSPEIFTEDKISPDKRDVSPPRAEITASTSSPSLSLSLKKSRPQVRSGGRAAQMLGLCVPDSLQNLKNNERTNEQEESKKSFTTPARRNLLILNNCGENKDNADENLETSESFLKLKRTLPSSDSSPSVPILKRKLIDIADEATVSPANKRKRVSFHDPPVSTTISVQKYIDPLGTRSPQSSVTKKLERITRQPTNLKSPKKLENLFKQDAIPGDVPNEHFDDVTPLSNDDTQMISLEETPTLEVVKTSDLNDKDPIYPELVDCTNPISDIASELSSPAMQSFLVKELEENIKTVGDLARLTELEVNRLCIKAPKVKVAQKVLSDYAAMQIELQNNHAVITERILTTEAVIEQFEESGDVKNLTEDLKSASKDQDMQTDDTELVSVQTQTVKSLHISRVVQTEHMSTEAVINTCLLERKDYVAELTNQLDDASKIRIMDSLPLDAVCEGVNKKIKDTSNAAFVVDSVLRKQNEIDPQNSTNEKGLSFIKDYVCERYSSSDLILFCSDLLKKIHDKTT